ncbi:MAG: polysaccharide deacetylase family protein [Polyangiaceae bacterium]
MQRIDGSAQPAPPRQARARASPPTPLVFHGPRSAGPSTDRPRIALTFDDGPDPLTREYLDLLDELRVRATFFVVGALVEKRPDDLAETVRRGHEVAGHGFRHIPFPTRGAALSGELLLTRDLLPPPGSLLPLVRPPRGSVSLGSVLRTRALGFTTVIWSVDLDDCRTKDPRVVEDRLAPRNVTGGDILLLHEGQR